MFAIAGDANTISTAAIRPPPTFGSSCCAITARSAFAEHVADALLFAGGEHADDPVHGLDGVVGVQGAEDDGAPLGGRQRHGDGLEVAHLADQDDVGVLPPGGASEPRRSRSRGCRPRAGGSDILVGVDELDRVLDGDRCGSPWSR